jgi:cytochrome P450
MATQVSHVPAHVPPHLVRQFDFQHAASMAADPWTAFSALNDAPDIFYSPDLGGYWMITRKALIEEAMASPELFSSAVSTVPPIEDEFRMIPPNLDPPDHAKYRKVIAQRIFSARALATVEDDARALIRDLIAQARPRGEGDFIADFARPFPISVFLGLMGMPRDRLSEFSHSIEKFFRGRDADEVGAARMAVYKFSQDWLSTDPDKSGSHILRELMVAEVDGRRLTAEELSNIVLTLFMAGLDTVTAQIAFTMHHLATHSEHRDLLIVRPDLINNAVEEMLRRFGIANLGRRVVSDIMFHGVPMKKGEIVMVSSVMAGLDEESYADAGAVNFERPNIRKHAAFGSGIHLCVGAHLARTELRVLLEEIVPGLPNFRLKPDEAVEYLPGTIMSLRRLPLVWDSDGN